MGQLFVSKIFITILAALFFPAMLLINFEQAKNDRTEITPPVIVPSSPVATSTVKATPVTQRTKITVPATTTPVRQPSSATIKDPPVKTTSTAGNVSTPGPLIRTAPTASVVPKVLRASEIIAITNIEREKAGLAPLAYRDRLSAMAEAKALDMIAKQYFAHVSPDGTDLSLLAKRYGYEYLNVGENLALGDFSSSIDVMTGWMNSPGHRANILGTGFTEIGITAMRGIWEGKETWFAVQEFGRPISDCPKPDPLLKTKITIYQDQLSALDTTLENLKAEINASAGDQASFAAKMNDYNMIVVTYNDLVTILKASVDEYNAAVQVFNACADGE